MAADGGRTGEKTRARLIALLRRGRRTVEELAATLGLTDNAVRAQLVSLQRAGVARAAEVRRDGTVGKPATLYDIDPAAESAFSRAYAPVLAALLAALRQQSDARAVEALLRDVGRRLGAAESDEPGRTPAARARQAVAVFASLGAEAELDETATGFVIRGYACPLSQAVREEPKVCAAVEELVSAVAGAPARECCDRSERPRCRFEIALPNGA